MNRMLCDNIIIKNKTLPLYENNGIYNLKKRKFKQRKNLHEFNMNTAVLTKKVKAGNLWGNIKKIFKKGKKFVKDAINYVDQSPILSTIKDTASEYIAEKTGINPNDYYNAAKNIVNSNPQQLKDAATNAAVKTIKDYSEKRKNKKDTKQKSNKMNEIKNIMTEYKNNLINEIPNEAPNINKNYSNMLAFGFAEGMSLPLAARKSELWRKWGPMFLLADSSTGKCGSVASDLLKTKYNLQRLALPKTLKELLMKVNKKDGNGRLYMGRGEEEKSTTLPAGSSTKKKNEKYMNLLASLKK